MGHRDAFPALTDEDIRKQLSLERKAKNRKSAQESRERRKRQEEYLNDRIPKGLALKRLLLSDNNTQCKSEDASSDEELHQMHTIIDEMADNFASDYDAYPQAIKDKAMIADNLIIHVLKQYLDNPSSDSENDSICNWKRIQIQFVFKLFV